MTLEQRFDFNAKLLLIGVFLSVLGYAVTLNCFSHVRYLAGVDLGCLIVQIRAIQMLVKTRTQYQADCKEYQQWVAQREKDFILQQLAAGNKVTLEYVVTEVGTRH